jgi:hypothetical protein
VKRQSSDPATILPDETSPVLTAGGQSGDSIVVLSRDVFFGMRIRTVLGKLGFAMVLVKTEGEFVAAMQAVTGLPVLGLLDFNQPVDWDAVRPVLAGEVAVIAFGSHTDVEGFRQAKAAGATRVTSNGDFNRSLPDLIAKYRTGA